jgi:hypothetical protein
MKVFLTLILVVVLISASMADVPQTINYQGRLTDDAGGRLMVKS